MYVLAAAVAALAAAPGCGTYHVKRTGVLPSYARLTHYDDMGEGDGRARAYFAQGFLFRDYDVLYVKPVEPAGLVRERGKNLDHYCAFLAERTCDGLLKLRKFKILTQDPEFLNRERYKLKAATLEMFITYLDEGSGFMRYVIGYDAGSVDVQVEGRVVDAETGEVLMEFADRRRYGGDTWQGLNIKAMRTKPVVEEMLVQHAYAVVKLFERRP